MIPTELDKQLILQTSHNIKIKLEVLNEYLQVIDEIEGQATSMNIGISATSDIRRTCNLTIHVTDDSFSAENFEVEYLDRLIRVSIGLHDGMVSHPISTPSIDDLELSFDGEDSDKFSILDGDLLYDGDNIYSIIGHNLYADVRYKGAQDGLEPSYQWYLVGSFLLDTDSYDYDAVTSDLSMNLVDMMAATMDVRGSQIGSGILIPYEANARAAILATVANFSPFAFYDADELPDVIPFDQEFEPGAYPYAILRQLLDLYPYYDMYYSPDGVFTVKPIPTGIGDDVLVDKAFMDQIIISERRSGSMRNIKNTTEIWGAELDATYMAHEVTHEGDTFHIIHTAPVEALVADTMFMFSPPLSSIVGQRIKIDDTAVAPLLDGNGNALTLGAVAANRLYVIKYSPTQDGETLTPRFLLQGEAIIHVIVKEVNEMPDAAYIAADKINNNCNDIQYIVNPDSPFACDRGGLDYDKGEIRQVFSGGEYSQIYTTQLAFERAAYENWLKTRLQTETEIECLLVPWMDVNTKIEYTSPITGVAREYLVKEISMNPTEFTMSLKLARFYPYYPWL
ncbi:MAG: DUF5048 domain-containing protein [Candidatus Sumerlaeales bacterium]|nr:DUF5048 domain-containing protein [Candidatus Sumerlaeales bacterium]